jgi:hypothetical protein
MMGCALEFIAAGPPLLHQDGDDEHDPEGFMKTWLSSINAVGSRSSPKTAP